MICARFKIQAGTQLFGIVGTYPYPQNNLSVVLGIGLLLSKTGVRSYIRQLRINFSADSDIHPQFFLLYGRRSEGGYLTPTRPSIETIISFVLGPL